MVATYLDKITTPLVESLPSYVKNTNHMLRITAESQFVFSGRRNYVFTMDLKSLYTVIPNADGLMALAQFFDKRDILEPPTLSLQLCTFGGVGSYFKHLHVQ